MANDIKYGDRVVVKEVFMNDEKIGVKVGMCGRVVRVGDFSVRFVMLDGFRGNPALTDVDTDGSVAFYASQLSPECPKLTISEAPRLDPSLAVVSADVGTAIEIYREAKRAADRSLDEYMNASEARVLAYQELDRAREAMVKAIDGELVGRSEG